MRKRLQILLAIFSFAVIQVNAQSFDLEKYNQEKELILNVVINSLQFDSVYTSKQVYFVANELLSEGTPLVLKKDKCKVKILTKETLVGEGKAYVHLSDFTMANTNPTRVRVQIYSSSTTLTLNLSLIKKDNNWIVDNHLIMED